MERVNIQIEDILREIPGSPDGVGYDLSLTKVYDDIKEAKFHEDSALSLGVWERELKKADWVLAENLANEAIRTQSKDLQILGWLIETVVTLDGFYGILEGMKILTEFVKTFWETCYPKDENNVSDNEQKFRILEWIYDTVAKKSKFIPFINYDSRDGVTLYDHEYATELKALSIKSPNAYDDAVKSAQQAGMRTFGEIQNILGVMPQERKDDILEHIQKIRDARTGFTDAITNASGQNGVGVFSALMGNLERIGRILTSSGEKRPMANVETGADGQKVSKSSSQAHAADREDIYDQIEILAKKLAIIEKHSPSSHMLTLIVSWKNKNLLEIVDDLKSGNMESHRLLKFLIT
ncbi:MAG: type VI secretion system ImpA family N-terminal domain-containing protein [Holosporales bacterium]|jgi:type VI secretion system protein ImpA|nr:type VI secretion system ImpA family N-terminal domain-containing protein [Holosporales bacterium]